MKGSGLIETLLRRPYALISFLTLFAFMGVMGFGKMKRKLFPDSNYPTVAVVMMMPGASAQTLASDVAVAVEEELYTLEGIRRVFSSTSDEVSVISAEFDYAQPIGTATSEVQRALDRIGSRLPKGLLPAQIHPITAATPPVLTVALSSDTLNLDEVRLLAQNEIRPKLLRLFGIADVALFGGHQRILEISISKALLDRYGLVFSDVIAQVERGVAEFSVGTLRSSTTHYMLTSLWPDQSIESLKALHVTPELTLGMLAQIGFEHSEHQALYRGNQKSAIALAIERADDADVIQTIHEAQKVLSEMAMHYGDIRFEITDTQEETIRQSTDNMFEALRDALVMSTLIVFIFLASVRQVLVVLLSIPIVYLMSIALMWLMGIEFNVVTLTAIILALGLLLDNTVVVVENIERHLFTLHDDLRKAVLVGTQEIFLPMSAGVITTMIALVPMLFVGGYPQTVFEPLVSTLLIAVGSSFVVAITAVPLLSVVLLRLNHPLLSRVERGFGAISGRFNTLMVSFFEGAVLLALKQRRYGWLYMGILGALFVISVKVVMPLVGQELMPPMDTGGLKISITLMPNRSIEESERVLKEAEAIIADEAELLRLSSTVGSEAGVMGIGSGGGIDQIGITATYVDRFSRDRSIWEIARALREKLWQIEGIKRLDVVDYGATALSSLRANVDVTLYSDHFDSLLAAATSVRGALERVAGIVSVSQTWQMDKQVWELEIDAGRAALFGLDRHAITAQVQLFLRQRTVGGYRIQNAASIPIVIEIDAHEHAHANDLPSLVLQSPKGSIPLESVARLIQRSEPSYISREGLRYTINVYGFREKAAISHLMSAFESERLHVTLPQGVEMEQTGDIKQFKDAASRMIGAITLAVLLIFLSLIVLFSSLKIAALVMLSIPLTIIGASWMVLAFDYHTSMPAMMGFILLSGVIVNNAILLIQFASDRMREEGDGVVEAMIHAIRTRTRPVLMTALAVSAGMLPVALGNAIGLERLAPLGAVAIGGLIVGTFLTLLFIPLFFIWSTRRNDATR
ncbi:MAG: efflux RND transporter permease subunit [Campylobacterales bacterium]|nr:efflux RND transporter permease subunit [Campylobacterales bacterium]